MMELLSLACLSIALKFGETCPPSLHEIRVTIYCNFYYITFLKSIRFLMSIRSFKHLYDG